MYKHMGVNMTVVCAMEESRKAGIIFDPDTLADKGHKLTDKEYRQYEFLCREDLKIKNTTTPREKKPKFVRRNPDMDYMDW